MDDDDDRPVCPRCDRPVRSQGQWCAACDAGDNFVFVGDLRQGLAHGPVFIKSWEDGQYGGTAQVVDCTRISKHSIPSSDDDWKVTLEFASGARRTFDYPGHMTVERVTPPPLKFTTPEDVERFLAS